jgi:predicted RNA-binding Zn-ribbon protein involved in translation (DUF1610 family)
MATLKIEFECPWCGKSINKEISYVKYTSKDIQLKIDVDEGYVNSVYFDCPECGETIDIT